MSDRCCHCDDPLHTPPGCAPDRYHEVSGHAQMPLTGLRATALDGARVASRVDRALAALDVTGSWLVHASNGLATWLFDLRVHTRASLDAMAVQLGIALVETDVPGAGRWACGRACRARYLQRESNVETASTCYPDDARTRRLIAAKGEPYDRARDPQSRIDCPVCGSQTFVPLQADPRRHLTAQGWRIHRGTDRWVCSAACGNLAAPVAPPVDQGAVAAADRAFVATLARERAAHAPPLPPTRKGSR